MRASSTIGWRAVFLALSVSLAAPALALAQGSGSTSRPERDRSFAVTRNLKCVVVDVDRERGIVVARDAKRGDLHQFRLTRDTKFEAHKKSPLADVEPLTDRHVEVGQWVRAEYEADSGELLEVKFLPPEKG